MNRMNRATRRVLPTVLVGALAISACDLDLTDPNNPTEDAVVETISGVLQVAVGLQAEYSNELVDPVYVSALVADEVGAGGGTFPYIQEMDVGGSEVFNSNGSSEFPWAGMYDVVQIADVLLESAPDVGMGEATLSGVLAMANTFKAMAFGNLLMTFERIPLDVDPNEPSPDFATREAGIERVFALLDEARQQLQAQPASETFNDEVLAPGLDLPQLVEAMTARYALAFERYDEAMAAADRVDLEDMSFFQFTANDVNPLWNFWLNGGNSTEMRPEDAFRLEAEAGDERVGFWVTEADVEGANVPLDAHARYGVREAPVPAVFPDEMRLIMAEVQARSGNLEEAIDLLNEVREPCSSPLDEPVACLPPLDAEDLPTQEAVLDQILMERRYELFALGVGWNDLKRFGEPVKYEFMPVPQSECDRNVDTPGELCFDF